MGVRCLDERGHAVCCVCGTEKRLLDLADTCTDCGFWVCKQCASYQRQSPFGYICRNCRDKKRKK